MLSCQIGLDNKDKRRFEIKSAFESHNEMLIDNLVDSVWYVKLETNDDCLLSMNNNEIEFSDNFIYYLSDNIIYKFSLTGKYVSKIDNHGHGPKDLGFINNIYWNNLRNELYVWDGMHRRLMIFDKDLNHKSNIPFTGAYSMIADSNYLYVGLLRDDFRKRGIQYCINKIDINTGDIVNRLKSRILSIETHCAPNFSMGTSMYKYGDNIYYLEHRSDTVFLFSKNDSVAFSHSFDIGEIYPPELDYPGDKKQNGEKAKYIDLKLQFENESYIFLTASHLNEKRIWLMCSKDSGVVTCLYSGEYNKVDGCFPFVWFEPVGNYAYYSGCFWPDELLEVEKEKKIMQKEKGNLKQLLSEIREGDNPLLMFVKFKKEYE